jgi:2'-5' RNA ligase
VGRSELACVLLPGEPLAGVARALKAELAAAHGHLGPEAPPHVTLKLGFAARARPLARHLAALAAEVAPLSLEILGPATFDEGILFLDVARSSALDALRRRLLAELAARFGVAPLPLEAGEGFRYHLTLGHLARPALEAARRSLDGRAFPSGTAERLGLLRFAGDRWVVEGDWALRGGG